MEEQFLAVLDEVCLYKILLGVPDEFETVPSVQFGGFVRRECFAAVVVSGMGIEGSADFYRDFQVVSDGYGNRVHGPRRDADRDGIIGFSFRQEFLARQEDASVSHSLPFFIQVELGGEDEGRRRRVLRIHGRPFPVRIHLHIFSLIPFRNHSENPARFIFRIRIEEPVFRFLIELVFEILIIVNFPFRMKSKSPSGVAASSKGLFYEVVFSRLATAKA